LLLKKKIKISYNYWYNTQKILNLKKKKFLIIFFSLIIHKKMNRYLILSNKNRIYNLSNGQILNSRKKKIVKFFKKSIKSISPVINLLNRRMNKKLRLVKYFHCKNYNYKNYLWIKKYFYLLKPTIYNFIITRAWSNVIKSRRRIKKKILKNLIKNSHKV